MAIENADLVRELQKIEDVLVAVRAHLDNKDAMNAALHMSTEVRPTPLASAVRGAHGQIVDLMARMEDRPRVSSSA